MFVPCRQSQMGGLWTGIRPEATSATSKMVSDYSGMLIQPHKVRNFVYACMRVLPNASSSLQ